MEQIMKKEQGVRLNEGKLKWSLFPFSVFGDTQAIGVVSTNTKDIECVLVDVLEKDKHPITLLHRTICLGTIKRCFVHTLFELPLESCIKVLMFGEKKYSAHNWKKGLKVTECLDSYMRHFRAYIGGQELDEESGLPHLGHMICNAMFATWMVQNKPEFDDRYKP